MPCAKTPHSKSAGRLLVSLLGRDSLADLAAELSLTLVVVVGSRLGALNQTLLHARMRRAARDVAGYVMNRLTPEQDLAQRLNPTALATLPDAHCLGSVPYLDDADRHRLAELGRPIAATLRGTDEP